MYNLRNLCWVTGIIAFLLTAFTMTYIIGGAANPRIIEVHVPIPTYTPQVGINTNPVVNASLMVNGRPVEGHAHPVKIKAMELGLDPNQVRWVAINAYAETDRRVSREERLRQMRAITWVVRNRLESGRWGDTYRDVLTAPRQFSWHNGRLKIRTTAGRVLSRDYYKGFSWDGSNALVPGADPISEQWEDALEIAIEVMTSDTSNRPFSKRAFGYYHTNGLTVAGAAGNAHARTGCRRDINAPHPEWMHGQQMAYTSGDLVVTSR